MFSISAQLPRFQLSSFLSLSHSRVFAQRLCCCDPMGYLEEARQNHVKKKVEEALRSKMKVKALKECSQLCEKYAQCASGRTISVIWRCRKEANDLNECLHQYTNDSVLEEMKKSYVLEQERKEKIKS